jgi:O-antigen/teichoic acid export membrane protein
MSVPSLFSQSVAVLGETARALRSPSRFVREVMQGSSRTVIGAVCVILQPVLVSVVSLPVTAYIIATLGPLDYGQWAVALTLVTSSAVLTNLGLRSYFVRAVARDPESAPEAFTEQLVVRMLLSIGAGCTAIAASYAMEYPALVHQCTAVLAVGAIFTSMAGVVSDLLQATERLPSLATINFVGGILPTLAALAVLWLGGGPLGLACAYLIGPFVTGLLSLVLVHRSLFPVRVSWRPRRYWALLKQARVLALQYVVGTLGTHAENLLVPKLVGLAPYGYFAAGTLLPRRMEVVPDGLATAFYPIMARTYHESRHKAIVTVKQFGLLQIAACLPPAMLVFALAGPISKLLFPESPDVCKMVIQISVWWLPLTGMAQAMGYAINAAGRERAEARVAIAATLVGLTLSVFFITKYGLVGACFALVARAAVGVLLRIPVFASTLMPSRIEGAAGANAAGLGG